MKLFITCDSDWNTRISETISKLVNSEFIFQFKNYGEDLVGISIVLMCRDPKHDFKQRIKFSKPEKKLYADIMLDYKVMESAKDDEERITYISNKIIEELPEIIKKYEFKSFKTDEFIADLKLYLSKRD